MGEKEIREIARVVERFKRRIESKYSVDRIVVFGSAARGEMKAESDVDIIVVSKRFGLKDFFEITPKLYREWHAREKIRFPVDILLYNVKEFEKLREEVSIVSEALREGIEL